MNRKSFVTVLLALVMLFACTMAVAEYDTHVTLTGTPYRRHHLHRRPAV